MLSGILEFAVKARRLASNPAAGVDLPPKGSKRRRSLTVQQAKAMVAAAVERGPVLLVLALCGLRWGEMTALRVRSVDLQRRRLAVEESVTEVEGELCWGPPKPGKSRSVPMAPPVVDALRPLIEGRDGADLLFTGPEGGPLRYRSARHRRRSRAEAAANLIARKKRAGRAGTPVKPDDLPSWFDRAAEATGVPGLTPHELRHTAASLAISSGASPLVVQRMLGHASAAMTLDIYADLFDADADQVGDRLDALWNAPQESAD